MSVEVFFLHSLVSMENVPLNCGIYKVCLSPTVELQVTEVVFPGSLPHRQPQALHLQIIPYCIQISPHRPPFP